MTKKNEVALYDSNRAVDVKKAAWNSLSGESQKAYQHDYKLFFQFIGKDAKNITANDVLSYIEHLREEGYKNSSINRKAASLSKMFKVMKLAGEIKENPVEVLKQFKNISMKTNKEVRISLSIDDIKKATKITKSDSISTWKTALIIKVLAMTGLRISEFTGIKNKDITDYDKENKTVRIVGKGRKERFIFLGNSIIKEVKELYPDTPKCEYLFYTIRKTRYDRRVLWLQIKDFFWTRIQKDVHPHLLRHAFITQKISVEKRDIKSVSRYAGHADVSTTLNMYVDKALDVNESKIKI
jgi:site-specific recombinase XerD